MRFFTSLKPPLPNRGKIVVGIMEMALIPNAVKRGSMVYRLKPWTVGYLWKTIIMGAIHACYNILSQTIPPNMLTNKLC